MTTEFDSWYALYPRKVAKGAARKAFAKARKIAPQDVLCAAAAKFAEKQTDKQFIPYPATWLNQERWLDEEGKIPAAIINGAVDRFNTRQDMAVSRVKLALKGIKTLEFGRADVNTALAAGAITKEQARQLGF